MGFEVWDAEEVAVGSSRLGFGTHLTAEDDMALSVSGIRFASTSLRTDAASPPRESRVLDPNRGKNRHGTVVNAQMVGVGGG